MDIYLLSRRATRLGLKILTGGAFSVQRFVGTKKWGFGSGVVALVSWVSSLKNCEIFPTFDPLRPNWWIFIYCQEGPLAWVCKFLFQWEGWNCPFESPFPIETLLSNVKCWSLGNLIRKVRWTYGYWLKLIFNDPFYRVDKENYLFSLLEEEQVQ